MARRGGKFTLKETFHWAISSRADTALSKFGWVAKDGREYTKYTIWLSHAQATKLSEAAISAGKFKTRDYPSTTPGKTNQEQTIKGFKTVIDCKWSRSRGANIYIAEWHSKHPWKEPEFYDDVDMSSKHPRER